MKKIILGLVTFLTMFSLVACGGEKVKEINIKETGNKIATALDGKTRTLVELDDEMVKSTFGDLSLVDEYSIYGSMMSPLETIAILKVKDGNVDKVKEQMENLKKEKVESAFYPADKEAMEVEGVAQVVVKGNYVGLFVLPDVENSTADLTNEAVNIFNKEFE